MNVKLFILTVINFVLIFIALLMIAGCMHDNKVLRGYNEQVQKSVLEIRKETDETQAQVRQVKTNSDIVLRIVTEGMFLEEEK
ncbi:MAG: hypothetical protein J6P07_07015 [Spirochaetaceae bacterium]|nr:hypothetical protein [Spirochaetaceae bacterium]MBO7735837.1 hypothetical protein [Methanobrevibacter sp.]